MQMVPEMKIVRLEADENFRDSNLWHFLFEHPEADCVVVRRSLQSYPGTHCLHLGPLYDCYFNIHVKQHVRVTIYGVKIFEGKNFWCDWWPASHSAQHMFGLKIESDCPFTVECDIGGFKSREKDFEPEYRFIEFGEAGVAAFEELFTAANKIFCDDISREISLWLPGLKKVPISFYQCRCVR